MSSTINDLKTPSSGGGVALDYANPVHSFKTDGASYTVPNDGNDYYLCGHLWAMEERAMLNLAIGGTIIATGYDYNSSDTNNNAPYINPLKLAPSQEVSLEQYNKLFYDSLHIFRAL